MRETKRNRERARERESERKMCMRNSSMNEGEEMGYLNNTLRIIEDEF